MFDVLYGQLERAYKKLKASVYFDKTQLVLRNRIVEYEGKSNTAVEDRLRYITKLLCSDNDQEWDTYKQNILCSIKALTYPKKVITDTDKTLIINDHRDTVKIVDKQYFIDIDVEGQILGILWVLLFGIDIDSKLYEHSYGNRINKRLSERKTKITSFSPYLFRPYYEQYESWRDIGLKHAQEALRRNQNVLILTMDFKQFFHSVDFSQEIFNNFYKEYINEKEDNIYSKRINNFVFDVISNYSNIFKEYKNRIFLPIGFFPSNILANWYLDKFDNEIINKWNPIYYGRYVDDIIIVEKIEKNSPVLDMIYEKNSDKKKEKVIEYFLCNCRNSSSIGCKNNQALLNRLEIDNDTEDVVQYIVNPQIFADIDNNGDIKAEIKLQNGKVKLFYFDHKGSNALITCFRNEISKNKSEFRYMPEDGPVFLDDDYSEIYEIKYSDTINKLRGVDGTSIDKFAFSKFLGKYLRIGSLISDKKESNFVKDLEKIFDNKTIIENYLSWEKVLLYLIVNEKANKFAEFVRNISKAIDKVICDQTETSDKITSIIISLRKVLFSAMVRALAHCWGPKIKKEINEISILFSDIAEVTFNISDVFDPYKKITSYRYYYCMTRMCDKYLMPALIDTIIDGNEKSFFTDDSSLNLSQLNIFMQQTQNLDLSKTAYKYYPYMITPQDISMSLTLDNIVKPSTLKLKDTGKTIEEINDIYIRLNYNKYYEDDQLCYLSKSIDCKPFKNHPENCLDTEEDKGITSHIIKVGYTKQKKFKIAVANATLKETDFIGSLTDFPNRSFDRYNKLSKIINTAIKNGSDILVLPELYVPFEWISSLARVSAKTKMAIITGVEHIKVYSENAKDRRMYNLTATILPYTCEEYVFSYVNFHTKVFYSPEEERKINGYGLNVKKGKAYDLFIWNDLWFSTYCCYELASIKDRCRFLSYVDLLAIVEWNPDTNYYSNIIESLSRDMHCYCVQVNSSDYGDSRITQPSKSELKDIIKTKGGENETVLIGEVDIDKLRRFQIKGYELQKDDKDFKPTPPEFIKDIVDKRIKGKLFEYFK